LLTLAQAADELPADTLLARGDAALGRGSYEEAVLQYQQGVQIVSDDDALETELSLYTNLGTALSTLGQNEDAMRVYEKAILIYKDKIDDIVEASYQADSRAITSQASFFLGMVYQDVDQPRDAADAYRFAHTLDPLHWASIANLGAVLHDDLGMHRDAVGAYNQAYTILTEQYEESTDPPPEPRPILSQLQYRIGLCISHDPTQRCAVEDNPDTEVGCNELAAHAFSLAVEYDPENESARHMLAAITADATMKRASNDYVKALFDDYAGNFEHSLVQELGYTGYERLRRGFDRAFGGSPPIFGSAVDAGCGTGLVGEQFSNVTKYLIGVDLSEAILQEAIKARPGLYNEVIAGDLTDVFVNKKPLDLIIAADSYIYFGDLDPLFAAMAEGLKVGGYAAFTLESVNAESEVSLQESKPDWRWQLTASGRFAHRKEYVEAVSRTHGLRIQHYEPLQDFRYERGVGVNGHVFVLQKGEALDEL
jgi:predicted TPR repeat methyltransferase